MATEQTIRKFFDRAIQREFSRDFLFRVISINFERGAAFDENELVYAKGGKIPQRGITNVTAPYMGLPFNLPGTVLYPGSDSYQLTLYCDALSELHEKFEVESRRVFDDAPGPFSDTGSTGDYNIPGYASAITLAQLDKQLNPIRLYSLIGASIRNVGEIEYQIAEGTGTVKDFPVTMSYHFYTSERV